jgi:hypothetical protein
MLTILLILVFSAKNKEGSTNDLEMMTSFRQPIKRRGIKPQTNDFLTESVANDDNNSQINLITARSPKVYFFTAKDFS